MLTSIRAILDAREQGFTLVELLVVMLAISLLAAIAIPSFLTQRVKAYDSCAQAMATSAHHAMEIYAQDNPTGYAGATVASLRTIDDSLRSNSCGTSTPMAIKLQATNNGSCNGTAVATSYCVRVTSKSGNIFTIDHAPDGSVLRVCRLVDTHGGCKPAGNRGVW